MTAHIQNISFNGIRTLDQFSLDLNGLTVLIGENGSGKSTIVEACELLRRLTNREFLGEYNSIHGGDGMLLRAGQTQIELGASICDNGWTAQYQIRFNMFGIAEEFVKYSSQASTESIELIKRIGGETTTTSLNENEPSKSFRIKSNTPAIAMFGWSHPDEPVREITQAIDSIDVQLPFNTTANWAAKSQGAQISPLRDSVTIAPTTHLERFGLNLANAFFALRYESPHTEWDYTMELVRLGLGYWVERIDLKPDAGGGKIAMWVKPRKIDKNFPTSTLSEGQLAYLAFVAMAQLSDSRSMLCFDEPELHMHPRLLTRVFDLLESISKKTPVLLTTHSRSVLDQLSDPAQSVKVLDLDQVKMRTVLQHLDKDALNSWLENYEGLGQFLNAGYQESFVTASESDNKEG